MAGRSLKQFVQFGLVGGLGTLTNLLVYFLVVVARGKAPWIGATAAFGVAVTQNYLLNQTWTFGARHGGKLALSRYVKFVSFSLLGFALNLAILEALIETFTFEGVTLMIPQAAGILAGMTLNFVASRWVTFR